MSEDRSIKTAGDKTEGRVLIQAQLPSEVCELRFDPIDDPCIVDDLHIYSNAGALQAIAKNGIEYKGKYVFLNPDPQFQIVLGEKQVTSLDIRAHVAPLYYLEQVELLSRLLEEEKNGREIHAALANYSAAVSEREELKRQLAQAQSAYNMISNATFWKLTKPARVLAGLIKKPFRRKAKGGAGSTNSLDCAEEKAGSYD